MPRWVKRFNVLLRIVGNAWAAWAAGFFCGVGRKPLRGPSLTGQESTWKATGLCGAAGGPRKASARWGQGSFVITGQGEGQVG